MNRCIVGLVTAASLALAAGASAQTFSGGGGLLPAGAPTITSGPANPYPMQINVAGVGTVGPVTVTLTGLSHTWPADLDILLVGPAGQSIVLMSDAGGGLDMVGLDITFDDAAASPIPASSPLSWASGSFQPANYGIATDTWPAPAPAGPYGSTLGGLAGTPADGTWSLYIVDDAAGDHGSLGGWSITFIPAPGAAALLGLGGLVAVRRRR